MTRKLKVEEGRGHLLAGRQINPFFGRGAEESRDGFGIESDGFIELWDVSTGAVLRRLVGHRMRVAAIAFAPDVKTLAEIGHVLDENVREQLWFSIKGF